MYNVLTEYHINMIFRMPVSCLCGMAIGFERKNRAKEAGVRTHCIVACTSAMMMIISKYGFEDLIPARRLESHLPQMRGFCLSRNLVFYIELT